MLITIIIMMMYHRGRDMISQLINQERVENVANCRPRYLLNLVIANFYAIHQLSSDTFSHT